MSNDYTIPIFIITKDRLKCLKQSIVSYRNCIKTPFEIIIHDNNSKFNKTIKYLEALESTGIKVYRNKKIYRNINDELVSVRYTIRDYFKTNYSPYYIVTDPDILFEDIRGDILEFYAHILKSTNVDVVGPALRIDNIPDYYPHKRKVLRHERKFWRYKKKICFKGDIYDCYHANIDTTFGMYRSKHVFSRPTAGLRTGTPYCAKHTDWYLNPKNLSRDQKYYKRQTYRISHWGKNI